MLATVSDNKPHCSLMAYATVSGCREFYMVPHIRISKANRAGINPDGDYVLYWMTAFRRTQYDHRMDKRTHIYPTDKFESGQTHDPLWNAAQMQLVREGRIHNYLRMLWGKKILEWSPSPKDALNTMIELNNKYAVDGRDPNSYSSIFWTLGRYDRAWAPERRIFGKIRYMSSENTARKIGVKRYVKWYAP
ncbi:MAG: hypothetical protein R6V25_02705 [Desulfatiglandales bacterium]